MSKFIKNLNDFLLRIKTSLSKPDKIHAAPVQKDDVTPRISPQTVVEEGATFIITEGSPAAGSPKNLDIVQIFEPMPVPVSVVVPLPVDVVEPVLESVAESVVEPVTVLEPVLESVAESVVEPVLESVVEPVLESVVEPVVESVLDSVVESVTVVEPVVEPVLEPVAESVDVVEPVTVVERVIEIIEPDGVVNTLQITTENLDSPVDSALSSLD